MKNELGTDKVTYDPNTGQRFVYVGAGKSAANPEAIIAYSPSDRERPRGAVCRRQRAGDVGGEVPGGAAARRRAAARGDSVNQPAAAQPVRRTGTPAPRPPPRPAAARATGRSGQLRPPTVAPRRPAWPCRAELAGPLPAPLRHRPSPPPQACAPSASKCRAPARPSASPKSSTPARNR